MWLNKWLMAGLVLLTLAGCATPQRLASPDGEVQAEIYLDQDNSLKYRLSYHQVPSVLDSSMGFVTAQGDYGRQVSSIRLLDSNKVDEVRQNSFSTKPVNDVYQSYRFEVSQPAGNFILETRLYNRGFAFRYIGQNNSLDHLTSELTSWQIPQDVDVWFFERDSDWKLKSYAGIWTKTAIDSLHSVSSQGPIQGKPLVMALPQGGYMLLTEAALADFSGMRFRADNNRLLRVDFTEGEQGFTLNKQFRSPWRLIQFADDLDQLVNTHIIQNLNPLPARDLFPTTDWIKPGRAVWSWWSRDDSYMSLANEKRFIDQAAELKFEYALIDDGWEKWHNPWQQLTELANYAAGKGIKLWVWKDSKYLRRPAQMTHFLDQVKQAGAVGIKVDFMNSEAKPLIDFDLELLQQAAERRLMVNFHGCQTSSGEYVSYPNELTREGIRGIELNIMGQPIPASHNAALPFTRMLTGPADYTPLAFSKPGDTSWGHQLATAFIFDSYLLSMAEDPGFILEQPGLRSIVPLLQELPVVWDETRILPQSEIGKLVVMMRRKADSWYLIALNGEAQSKKLDISWQQLGGQFSQLQSWQDQGQRFIRHQTTAIDQGKPVSITLRANGGAVFKLSQ
ncbi:glycoside hydrolase family 97 catalytic domain-containing protein [Neptunicella sp. SCSIO 80796]|uniref:glycoside hydrolase family 97 protein n=1 Tax=Neptunicella plasticusilytica TaxID=3117012 RepID=UPI003A4DE19B